MDIDLIKGKPHHSLDLLGNQYVLYQDTTSLEHGTTVWSGSLVLSEYLLRNVKKRDGIDNKNLSLELGSGCGLSGIVLASLNYNVLLSDREEILNNLNLNISGNYYNFPKFQNSIFNIENSEGCKVHQQIKNSNVASTVINWSDPTTFQSLQHILERNDIELEYVLISDCCYDKSSTHLIIETLKRIVRISKTKVLISFEKRDPLVYEYFLVESKKFFKVLKVNKIDDKVGCLFKLRLK